MNSRRVYQWPLMALFAVLMVMASCRGGRDIAGKPINGKSPQYLMKRMEANSFNDYSSISAKIATQLTAQGKTYNLKTTLRLRKDSAIWLSMSPALGIEAIRLLVTPDSIKFIDKINKKYWVGSFEDVRKVINADLDYNLLQDFFAGNAIGFDFEGKYKSSVDDSLNVHLLTSKNPKKVRKAVEFKDDEKKNFESDTTGEILVNENKLEKALEKVDDEALIISRYWIEPDMFRPVRIMVNDLANSGTLEISYADYDVVEDDMPKYPHSSRLYVTDMKEVLETNLSYSKVKFNRALNFPFTISDKYEKIVF